MKSKADEYFSRCVLPFFISSLFSVFLEAHRSKDSISSFAYKETLFYTKKSHKARGTQLKKLGNKCKISQKIVNVIMVVNNNLLLGHHG